MILENGVVRTMDPSLPVARALAIAGDRVAGGVGTHETALPSPEVVDLGGRCALPGFTDSHVHFPTWSLAQRDVRLEGVSGLDEALERVRVHPRRGQWIRGTGWRSADWESQPTNEALDQVTGSAPAALWSKDYHSLWLNSAALALAGGDLEVEGGVVERDAEGAPTGVLREESAWRFRAHFGAVPEDEWVEATRDGLRLAAAAGSAPCTTRTAGLERRESSGGSRRRRASRCASGSRCRTSVSRSSRRSASARGIGDDFLRIGYLKAFMDGTLGSQTAWMLDGSGVRITSGEELADVVRRGARAGWPVAVHAIGDRANREALDAFEATRDEWAPLRPAPANRARAVPRAEDVGRFAELGVACSVQFSHAPSDRDLAERFWADRADGAYAFRSLCRLGRARRERLGRADRGARPARGHPRRRPADDRRPAGVASGAGRDRRRGATSRRRSRPRGSPRDERRRGKLLPGFLADLVVLSRDPLECPPDELETVEVVATMVGGRWVYGAPPWD